MSLFTRHRWFVLAAAITFAFAIVSLVAPRGPVLTAISDIGYFLLTLTVGITMLSNAWSTRGATRHFWALMGSGCILWACDLSAWTYPEVIRRMDVPHPWFMDVFLFIHLVPMIAAIGLRPHRAGSEPKFRLGTLDFLLLLVWWMFLYAFVVFPSQYIAVDVVRYDRSYGILYLVESAVLVSVLGMVATGAPPKWKLVYLNLTVASAIYALDSQAVNLAVSTGQYYTGSLYDVLLWGAVCWMAATALTAREWQPEAAPPKAHDK